ncbi:MAG: addiction module protein [Opitutaceae bacterium]|nr:addiction module protein [Opitutaceae bacterium]
MPATLPELLRLPKKRRMEIAERLWASVENESDKPVPAAHRAILDKRLASYRAGKSKVITHAELMRRLRES